MRVVSIRSTAIAILAVLLLGPASLAYRGEVQYISVDELKAMIAKKQGVFVIDARGSDFDASSTKIKGAVHITAGDIEARLKDIPRNKTVVTYCACSDDGSAISAAEKLLQKGYPKVKVLKGGWDAWNKAGGAVEPK